MRGIFWFRRDLRLNDNIALIKCLKECNEVILIYIHDTNNTKLEIGGALKWWLHHSLNSLQKNLADKGLNLVIAEGNTIKILSQLVEEYNIDNLYYNRTLDDIDLEDKLHSKIKCNIESFYGNLLIVPTEQNYKKIFTPFWKANFPSIKKIKPLAFKTYNNTNINTPSRKFEDLNLLPTKPDWSKKFEKYWNVGEKSAQNRLSYFLKNSVATYHEHRDIPSLDKTSMLSPHLHFGEISPNQIWYATMQHTEDKALFLKGPEHFLRELGWREFAYHTMFYFHDLPNISMRDEFNSFPWKTNKELMHKWTKGLTGYPIVDAGMRQLYETGWLHNRVRMIVGSFLVKHLLLPWQDGAAWFLDTLVDADLSSNSAGWQWVAGCGVDSAPYFRIFNPIIQGEKFDPEGTYVKKYCPELTNLPAKYIHKPWEAPSEVLAAAKVTLGMTYPKPIVDHNKARQSALEAFEKIKK